jgi:hypothetical protein
MTPSPHILLAFPSSDAPPSVRNPASVVARQVTRSTPFPRAPLAWRGLEIILTRSGGVGRGRACTTAAEALARRAHLALDIYEGQRLAWKNDHRVGPCRAGAPKFAPVDSLGR